MNEFSNANPIDLRSSADGLQSSFEPEGILGFLAAIGTIALRVHEWKMSLIAQVERADRDDRRRQLWVAYKVRRTWRVGDVHALKSLGASDAAIRRAYGRKGRGRPSVRRYVSTAEFFGTKIRMALRLLTANATENERREAFFVWPWWKHHAEAIYRGELDAARAVGTKGAYDLAERAVAKALGISSSKLHAVGSEIRAIRHDDEEMANFPAVRIADFERWMKTGEHPFRD